MVIFGTGVVTGGLLVHHERTRLPRPQHIPGVARPGVSGTPVSAGGLRLEFLRRAQRELDLTPRQREQVDKLIKESQERTRKLMQPITPELNEELRRTRAEFQEVLTPDQRKRFDELVRQQRAQPRRPSPPRPEGAPGTNAP